MSGADGRLSNRWMRMLSSKTRAWHAIMKSLRTSYGSNVQRTLHSKLISCLYSHSFGHHAWFKLLRQGRIGYSNKLCTVHTAAETNQQVTTSHSPPCIHNLKQNSLTTLLELPRRCLNLYIHFRGRNPCRVTYHLFAVSHAIVLDGMETA